MITRYLGAVTILLLLGMVLTRVALLRRRGVDAMRFGEIDKSDYAIPPFAFFYFYLIFANAFGWPTVAHSAMLAADWIAWLGVASCVAGLTFLAATLRSFGESFRVGIDESRPGRLVTTGVFGLTRNPIYVAFAFVLLGEFPHFQQLDSAALSRRRHRLVPPSGAPRGTGANVDLWRRISRLLRARWPVFVRTVTVVAAEAPR